MSATAGYSGSAKIGANAVALVTSWNLDAEVDMLETTSLGSGNKAFVPGLFGASGTIECSFDYSDTNGQKALHDGFFAKTTVALKLYVDGTHYYDGTAYISKISPSDDAGDLVTISFDFQFTGAVTFS